MRIKWSFQLEPKRSFVIYSSIKVKNNVLWFSLHRSSVNSSRKNKILYLYIYIWPAETIIFPFEPYYDILYMGCVKTFYIIYIEFYRCSYTSMYPIIFINFFDPAFVIINRFPIRNKLYIICLSIDKDITKLWQSFSMG